MALPRAILLAMLLTTPGCVRWTVEPYDLNYDATPVHHRKQTGSLQEVEVRGVSIDWDTNAVGDVARKNGLRTLHYADLEVLSVSAFGVGWKQETLRLYGE